MSYTFDRTRDWKPITLDSTAVNQQFDLYINDVQYTFIFQMIEARDLDIFHAYIQDYEGNYWSSRLLSTVTYSVLDDVFQLIVTKLIYKRDDSIPTLEVWVSYE
jgi:hypothetical protein